jgi:sugar/nucleoside kinase (ribokinase family)
VAADLDLLVLGDANPDLVLHGGDIVPSFGQAEHLVESARLTIGGSGAILACGAAKLGLRVAISAVVGDDLFGRFMRDALTAAGVDTSGITIDETMQTGITVVLSGTSDRAILTMPGTIAGLRVDLIDPSLLARARHVHASSYYLQTALVPSLPALFEEVHRAGATTSVDPNWDPSGAWDGGLLELLHSVDVFLPNAMEATRSAHTSDLEGAVRALGTRARFVVVKDGDRGAVAGGDGHVCKVDGVLTQAVDTTGAGDAFDAGFLAAWLRGESLERALTFANACGSLSTRAMGGVEAQPTMDEVLALLDEGSAA